jgi:hypothetical protein
MAKKNKPGKNGGQETPPAVRTDEAGAGRRTALLRHKLTRAMDDPLMRDQIVRAIRSMMTEDKK